MWRRQRADGPAFHAPRAAVFRILSFGGLSFGNVFFGIVLFGNMSFGDMSFGDTRVTIVVVMGVAGSGKSVIGGLLAAAEGWTYLEGDGFHPAANVAKMAAGTPLVDEDRWPWLRALADAIDAIRAGGGSAVVACSALRRVYRDVLIGDRSDVRLVYLRGARAVIGARLAVRAGHFMPAALLDSQFATLEEPGPAENPVIADADGAPDEIVDAIRKALS